MEDAKREVVLVAVDARSLRALNVWPWPRGYHATVIENLVGSGTRRVAFDVDFSSRSVITGDARMDIDRVAGREYVFRV